MSISDLQKEKTAFEKAMDKIISYQEENKELKRALFNAIDLLETYEMSTLFNKINDKAKEQYYYLKSKAKSLL